MLLTDQEFVRMAAEALSREVLPELKSKNAQAAAGLCIQALRELLHRDAVLPGMISNIAPRGSELLLQGRDLLDRAEIALPSSHVSGDALQARAAIFSLLAKQLDDMAKSILALSRSSSAFAQEASAWLRAVAEWETDYYVTFQKLDMPDIGKTDISGRPLTAEILLTHLRSREPSLATATIGKFESIPGGMSNETYFFDLCRDNQPPEELVVRKKALRPFFDFWANRARDEFEIVTLLHEQGIPVAKPLRLFEDMPELDSDYYVMTRGSGSIVGAHDAAFGTGKTHPERLLLNIAEFLAKLHGLPLSAFDSYLQTGDTTARAGDTITDIVGKNVEFLHDYWLTSKRRPCASEAFVLDWLMRNVPVNHSPPSLVHTDCFVHNILVDENHNITTVVDWESAHFGDPAEDLAYIKDQVSATMDWSRFMDHYYRCGGRKIDESHIDYYKTLLNFRNSWGTNIAVTRVDDGFFDIRMAALGSCYFTTWMETVLKATQ